MDNNYDKNVDIKWIKCRGLAVILHSPRGKNGQGIGRKPPTIKYGYLSKKNAVDALIKINKINRSVSVGCPYLREINSEQRGYVRGICGINGINTPTCIYLKNRFYKV